MKQNQFITIHSFMRTDLGLKGSELIVCALIYGFSQDGISWFQGATDYIAEWTGTDRKNVLRVLRNLVAKGVIIKQEIKGVGSIKKCFYQFNEKVMEDVTRDQLQNVTRDQLQNVTRINNNINKDNIDNNILSQQSVAPNLFGEKEDKIKKTLFRNSQVFSLVKEKDGERDYTEFLALFKDKEYANIDMIYYFHCVSDWSEQKDMKRTNRGWLATIRNFIRGDIEKGKLHTLQQPQAEEMKISDAMEYLNNEY